MVIWLSDLVEGVGFGDTGCRGLLTAFVGIFGRNVEGVEMPRRVGGFAGRPC